MPTETQTPRLIDANALIEALREKSENDFSAPTDWKLWFESAIMEIESFPVSDGWIPVSERLPEEWKWVTTYSSDGRIWRHLFEGWMFHPLNWSITHWQPLPNPPTSHK